MGFSFLFLLGQAHKKEDMLKGMLWFSGCKADGDFIPLKGLEQTGEENRNILQTGLTCKNSEVRNL